MKKLGLKLAVLGLCVMSLVGFAVAGSVEDVADSNNLELAEVSTDGINAPPYRSD